MDRRLRDMQRLAASGDVAAQDRLRREGYRGGTKIPKRTFQILVFHLESLKRKAKAIRKFSAKWGSLPLLVEESEGARRWIPRSDGELVFVSRVTVSGEIPELGRFRVVGVIQHRKTGNVIETVHGFQIEEEELERFRQGGKICEACDLRRDRLMTHLVMDTISGKIHQVGTSCLEPYRLSQDAMTETYVYDETAEIIERAESGDLDDTPDKEIGYQIGRVIVGMIDLRKRNRVRLMPVLLFCRDWSHRTELEDSIIRTTEAILSEARAYLNDSEGKPREDLSRELHNVMVLVNERACSYRNFRHVWAIINWWESRGGKI